ncbi:plasmid maintenance system antidote protein VapI [Pseudomonas nitritireducens]|uniref:Plasmid maintenance system antidote protein VapI n=1 Tax=Pseudomonas nitroreducens TaxID=46680 RepID=A0A7W7P345_PSENT|nr:hypothetical protein [Pseudomonas nitritireducens]MBB4865444.1 plasmid maintenance system antidote protein VapI [Pseudomonas nitritireducens]
MSRSDRTKVGVGHLIDTIWKTLPADHPLRKIKQHLPLPIEESLLKIGSEAVDYCVSKGAKPNMTLDEESSKTWKRLVGAWVHYQKYSGRATKVSRAVIAQHVEMDASSITNFINGKRALTQGASIQLANFFGFSPIDIRPDIGSQFARKLAEKGQHKSILIERQLNSIEALLKESEAAPGDPIYGHLTEIRNLIQA